MTTTEMGKHACGSDSILLVWTSLFHKVLAVVGYGFSFDEAFPNGLNYGDSDLGFF